jgi:hypothetical protein
MKFSKRVNNMAEQSNLKGTVRVSVAENVTLEHLQGIVARVAGMTGCRTCGIMGVDLRLSGDPVESQDLSKLAGVKSVSFGA